MPKLNPHHMDRAKVMLLLEIARLNTLYPWVYVTRDINTTRPDRRLFTIVTDDVHALRLKWFGLLRSKGRRSGGWQISDAGVHFVKGLLKVPQTIWVQGGRPQRRSVEEVSVTDVAGVVYDRQYWDQYNEHQRYPQQITHTSSPVAAT